MPVSEIITNVRGVRQLHVVLIMHQCLDVYIKLTVWHLSLAFTFLKYLNSDIINLGLKQIVNFVFEYSVMTTAYFLLFV